MTHSFCDQTGNTIYLEAIPRRIISLVPSQTELFFDLGLDEEIVGVTDFCIHPESRCALKKKVGGPKSVDMDAIDILMPDVIIANREENEECQIKALSSKYPVWISDITSVDEALSMIEGVGELVGKEVRAREITAEIRGSLFKRPSLDISVAYVIWDKPLMVAGGNTFIDQMMAICGLNNAFSFENRYPAVNDEDIKRLEPDVIMLSSEPYSFDEAHLEIFRARFPAQAIFLVDGEMFSWYGSRLLYAGVYFAELRARIKRACRTMIEMSRD